MNHLDELLNHLSYDRIFTKSAAKREIKYLMLRLIDEVEQDRMPYDTADWALAALNKKVKEL